MRSLFLLTIVLSLMPFMVMAEPETSSEEVASSEQYSSEGEIPFSPSDSQSSNISNSFKRLMECSGNPSLPECKPCHSQENMVPREIRQIQREFRRRCIPSGEEQNIAYSRFLTSDEILARDSRICGCFDGKRGNFHEQGAYNHGREDNGKMSEIEQTMGAAYTATFNEVLDQRMDTNRAQNVFSTMSFIDDNFDSVGLSTNYAGVRIKGPGAVGAAAGAAADAQAVNAVTTGGAAVVGSAMGIGSISQQQFDIYTDSKSKKPITKDEFNTNPMPDNICIPYRYFIASKQFPTNPDFFDGFKQLGNKSSDWNYQNLISVLKKNGADKNLEETLRNSSETKFAFARLQFLHDNPVFKNILLSSDETVKTELIQNLSKMPECRSANCRQSAEWKRGMNDFRRSMAGFLAKDEVMAAADEGSGISGKDAYDIAGYEAQVIASSSSAILPGAKINDGEQWRSFCHYRVSHIPDNEPIAFLSRLENNFGKRNFSDLEADKEFQDLNNSLCGADRKNARNETLDFNGYFERTCVQKQNDLCVPEKRGELLAKFFTEYSTPVDSINEELITSIVPFFKGEIGGPRVIGDNEVNQFNSQTRVPRSSRQPFSFRSREYAGLTPASNRIDSPNRAPASTSANIASANAPAVQPVNAIASEQAFVPVPVLNQAAAAAPKSEVLRSNLEQNANESRQIREEIFSLKNVIKRGPNEETTPAELRDLNSRLAQLEQRLSQKDRENADLRRQIDEERSKPRTEVASAAVDTPSRRERSSASTVDSQAAVPQAGVSGGAISAPLMNGPASLNGNNGSSLAGPISSRSPSLGPNLALLSKYGVQSVSEQGALIVASSSSSIDYKSLQSQTANSVLPLSVTPEEFNLLANNDQSALNRYLDQVRAVPGDVVRINLTAGRDQSMELFVVKKGGQISIVQGQGSANRAPAAVDSRQYRLADLLNEFGT